VVNRTRVKGLSILAVVFLLGVLAGGAGAFAWGQRRVAALVSDEEGTLRESRRLRALSRKLELTGDQEERIAAVFQKQRTLHREAMESMFAECGEDVRALRTELDANIRAVLTPEQQAGFDEITAHHRERWLRGRGGRKGHRPPHAHPSSPPGRP
jgi:Spy/CpxP family protein refolding chaperone